MKKEPFTQVYTRLGRVEIRCGTTLVDDGLRADMFLPADIYIVGWLLVSFGAIFGCVMAVQNAEIGFKVFALACSVFILLSGVFFLLLWRNQTILMLSEDEFVYKTALGKKTVYRFEDIYGLEKSMASLVLRVGGDKINIETFSILSNRLANRITAQLVKLPDNDWLLE